MVLSLRRRAICAQLPCHFSWGHLGIIVSHLETILGPSWDHHKITLPKHPNSGQGQGNSDGSLEDSEEFWRLLRILKDSVGSWRILKEFLRILAGFSRLLKEFWRILWNSECVYEILECSEGFWRIPWFLKDSEGFFKILEDSERCWRILEDSGKLLWGFWSVLGDSGRFLRIFGFCEDFDEFYDILKDSLDSLENSGEF